MTDQHGFKPREEMKMLKRLILIGALFLWPAAAMADVQADMAIQRGPSERLTPENTVLIYVDYTT
ncbi:hypothetical protein, partial [Hoeflea sp.]|uniref:hypothetical protein n=1 Tax=Hoeflea sp. TaxID=1940281 RepID=UPI002730CD84